MTETFNGKIDSLSNGKASIVFSKIIEAFVATSATSGSKGGHELINTEEILDISNMRQTLKDLLDVALKANFETAVNIIRNEINEAFNFNSGQRPDISS